jgi:SAM-dependent methyltransferase
VTQPVRPELSVLLLAYRRPQPMARSASYLQAMQWLTGRLSQSPHPKVIDIGCGAGLPADKQLADAGAAVVGIDPSAAAIDLARHNVPEAIYTERELSDLDGLHPVGARFDAAICLFALAALPRDEVAVTLRAIANVLRSDAAFLLAMPEGDLDHELHDFAGEQVPLTAYPHTELQHLLATAGFHVVEVSAEPATGQQKDLYMRCLATPHTA